MKQIVFALSLSMAIFIVSCDSSESFQFEENDIVGAWNLESLTIDGKDLKDISPGFSYATSLVYNIDKTYYRNYISGTWSLEKDKICLKANPDLDYPDWSYRIISMDSELLIIELEMSTTEYCCTFENYDTDQMRVIVETYSRQ